ncbi:MAG: LysR family transcriptional regulator [Clostridiaceae bacterium]|jgi:DNA-binding transcriptional LysR family regulator|nr:LysR family transcriptional regulator [Clostridiaceae bacterium]
MDFKKLKYILTVAEVQSISKAAAILYISQPSLSHVISNLETELGIEIFNRTTTPISLTYAGEKFVKTAREILNMDNQLKKEFSDISGMRKGRIIIGIPAFRGSFMLPHILPVFHKEFPGIQLSLFEGSGQELEYSLLNGKVDIVFTGGPINEERIVQEVIYKEKIKIACKKGYLSREYLINGTEDVIDFSKLNNFDFILTRKGHIIRTYSDEIFDKNGISPNIILETSNSGTAYRLAVAGMGLSFAAEMTINSVTATEEYDLFDICSPSFAWEVVAMYRKDTYITIAERRLIDLAKDAFSKKI